jgi:hypothetical protein
MPGVGARRLTSQTQFILKYFSLQVYPNEKDLGKSWLHVYIFKGTTSHL